MPEAWGQLVGLYERMIALGEEILTVTLTDNLESAERLVLDREYLVLAAGQIVESITGGKTAPDSRQRDPTARRLCAIAAEQNRRIRSQLETQQTSVVRALAALTDGRTSVSGYQRAAGSRSTVHGGQLDRRQ